MLACAQHRLQKRGQTCLHYCFKYKYDDCAALLLKRGADDTITNVDGLTCYEGLTVADLDDL